MNLEALLVIGGLSLVLLAILAGIAVWIHRRARTGGDQSPNLTGAGLLLFSTQAFLMLCGAIAAQRFDGVAKFVFAAIYLLSLFAVLTVFAKILKKRGYPLWGGHLTTRSSGP